MTTGTWHAGTVAELSRLLARDADVKALVLMGSLASQEAITDEWSDVDARIVVADTALSRYYPCPAWLAPLGGVVACQSADHEAIKTLRVCLTPFRRLDLSIVAESSLRKPEATALSPIPDQCKVIWSCVPDPAAAPAPLALMTDSDRRERVEAISAGFWFKVTLAIPKVARNDLLVAAHLAFDLVRDCLELQMMLRDKEMGTNIHRRGGWGNDILSALQWAVLDGNVAALLDLIGRCCRLFDRLAEQLSDAYQPRAGYLTDVLARAAGLCEVDGNKSRTETKC